MDFDWMTALLEAVNFLVLVWLLKRFLYRPVLDVIEKRRAENERILAEAQAHRHEAEVLQAEYESRLAEAGRQRDLALTALDKEVAGERARRLDAVKAEAEAEHERRQMLAARDAREHEATLEREAVHIAARFAGRFLDRLAGPELEARLVDMALVDLAQATAERRATIAGALREPGKTVEIASAHPLAAAQRAALTARLSELAGAAVVPAFGEDPELKAGLRITAGAWVLQANLRDELEFFAQPPDHDR